MKHTRIVQLSGIIFILLIIFSSHEANGIIVLQATTYIISLVTNLTKLFMILKDNQSNKDQFIIKQLNNFAKDTETFRIDLEIMKDEIINKVVNSVSGLVEINRRFSKVFINTRRVQKYYTNFIEYIQNPSNFNPDLIEDFALQIISEDKNGIDQLLEEIHGLVVLHDATSISGIGLLMKSIEEFIDFTKVKKSPQQVFYEFLHVILYTEIQGHLTIQFSYRLLQECKEVSYEGHLKKSVHDFAVRINNTINAFSIAMASASREFWKNNPTVHVEGTTYIEFEHLFQEYIVNEYDISTSDRCFHTCDAYKNVRSINNDPSYRCYYGDEICGYQHPCMGPMFDCRAPFQDTMYICRESTADKRRYRYINVENDQTYGIKGKCSNPIVEVTKHYDIFPNRCDPCLCVCDDANHDDSVRLFNLEKAMSRVKHNYVVTGIRLVKQNKIIHIQIQEGQLLPNGVVNESSVTWAPIKHEYNYYHKISWNNREVILDDLHVPENHVLTGLAFISQPLSAKSNRSRSLHLKIISNRFNFTTGVLEPNNQHEVCSLNFSDEIPLSDLLVPTQTSFGGLKKSKPGQFFKFTVSSLKDDLGQTTLPLLDVQELTTNPPIPMTGAGLYHKSTYRTGGYLALKLFTYNFQPYLNANLPPTFSSDADVSNLSTPHRNDLHSFIEANKIQNKIKDKTRKTGMLSLGIVTIIIILFLGFCYFIYRRYYIIKL